MTNREAYKDKLDDLLARIIAVVDGEPVRCGSASCKRCLFQEICGKPERKKKIIDWLNAEYQEPPVDWSKVPIGKPETYDSGATSWSIDDKRTCTWTHMRLAEGNE